MGDVRLWNPEPKEALLFWLDSIQDGPFNDKGGKPIPILTTSDYRAYRPGETGDAVGPRQSIPMTLPSSLANHGRDHVDWKVGETYFASFMGEKTTGKANAFKQFHISVSEVGVESVEAELDEKLLPTLKETRNERAPAPKMYRASELIELYKNTRLPWVSPGLLLRGEVTLVVGSAKIGKSTLLLQLLHHITTGDEWAFGKKKMKQGHAAIYYSLEMGEVPLAKRMAQLFARDLPDNLWVVPARDYTIDWDEIAEKVDATKAAVVVIDNLLGTNIGDVNKQEVAGNVMNAAFAFAQEKNVSVVIVHHTRKGSRNDQTQQQVQQGDILDEAHGSKVFANKAGIIVLLRKTTGDRGRSTYGEISVVSRFGQSKTIKATFDRAQSGRWRRRSQEDATQEDDGNADLEDDDDEQSSEKRTLAPPGSAKVVSPDLTHVNASKHDDLSTGTNVVSTKVEGHPCFKCGRPREHNLQKFCDECTQQRRAIKAVPK